MVKIYMYPTTNSHLLQYLLCIFSRFSFGCFSKESSSKPREKMTTTKQFRKLMGIGLLSEDELALIVDKLSPADRKSFTEVCKFWYEVERVNRSSLRLLDPPFPRRQVFQRYPNLVEFETSYSITDSDLKFLGQTYPRLEVVNLSTTLLHTPFQLLGVGLLTLAAGCPKLRHLELRRFFKFSDEALQAIGSSSSISYLNLENCYGNITDDGIGFLVNGAISKTLKTLILDGINITDVGVSHLQKLNCLEHLSLAGCNPYKITDIGGVAISAIPTLKILRLDYLCKVTDPTIVAIAKNCPNLKMVDLSDCGITGAGIRAFAGHASLQTIVLKFCKVGAFELRNLVRKCPSLKSIVLDHKTLKRIFPRMRERARRSVEELPQMRKLTRRSVADLVVVSS